MRRLPTRQKKRSRANALFTPRYTNGVTQRIRIDLAYDGTGFSGWAKQPERKSVAGVIEDALSRVLRTTPAALSIVVAGRTDAGVHATGQVCHVDFTQGVNLPRDEEGFTALARRLNGAVGKSGQVVIHRVSLAPDGFDARFSPLTRRYSYLIADRHATKDPRTRHYTLWLEDSLDEAAMNSLGEALVGLHDWASFCRARAGATTIRDLQRFSWGRQDGGVLAAEVIADAFCHSMVRSLVGAAVAVGSGRLAVAEVLEARKKRERTSLWKTMPARGLTLKEVIYPPDSELAARGEQTRGVRSLPSN
jgi:tRNA pseudouridine38-40 synthase